jgi:exopolyphosphatase/guanosine-5'-triphosphate,3'-diphosphate pyrophosphatase
MLPAKETPRRTSTLRAGVEDALRGPQTNNAGEPVQVPPSTQQTHHEQPEQLRVFAVIDVGSSSVRMSCVRVGDDGSWTLLADEREMTRLAERDLQTAGASTDGQLLSRRAMERSADAIARFANIARGFGAQPLAVATAAVRSAANQQEFLLLVRASSGVELAVLGAADEARASFDAAMREAPVAIGPCVVLDIGGGSLQLTQALHGVVIDRASMPLGAIALTQRVRAACVDATSAVRTGERERKVAEDICDEVLGKAVKLRVSASKKQPLLVLGAGGTLTTLLAIVARKRGLAIDRRDPKQAALLGVVSLQELRETIAMLATLPAQKRDEVAGVSSDRSDIILCGLVAAERGLLHMGASHVRIIAGGVREGLLWQMARGRELLSSPLHGSAHTSLLAHAGALLDRCAPHSPHAMAPHARHVAHLSLRLFASLAELLGWKECANTSLLEQGTLLHAGALVHDVGVMVGYKQHHKHGARIVRGCWWPSVHPDDLSLLALLARYHRRAHPKERHEAYMQLSSPRRALLVRLASVLRIADGLDRTHTQRVTDVRAYREGTTVVIEVASAPGFAGALTAELRAASDKAGLLEELVGCDVVVR